MKAITPFSQGRAQLPLETLLLLRHDTCVGLLRGNASDLKTSF